MIVSSGFVVSYVALYCTIPYYIKIIDTQCRVAANAIVSYFSDCISSYNAELCRIMLQCIIFRHVIVQYEEAAFSSSNSQANMLEQDHHKVPSPRP